MPQRIIETIHQLICAGEIKVMMPNSGRQPSGRKLDDFTEPNSIPVFAKLDHRHYVMNGHVRRPKPEPERLQILSGQPGEVSSLSKILAHRATITGTSGEHGGTKVQLASGDQRTRRSRVSSIEPLTAHRIQVPTRVVVLSAQISRDPKILACRP